MQLTLQTVVTGAITTIIQLSENIDLEAARALGETQEVKALADGCRVSFAADHNSARWKPLYQSVIDPDPKLQKWPLMTTSRSLGQLPGSVIPRLEALSDCRRQLHCQRPIND